MTDQAERQSEAAFNATVARALHREALRRAAHEQNTTSGPGLESILARISAETTTEAQARQEPHSSLTKR